MKTLFILIFIIVFAAFLPAAAQSRDFLTEDEIEIVRDAQQIDQRVTVLVHAIDRRFALLKVNVNAPVTKEAKEWGALPEGTRMQLLVDIKRILQKAVDDIDNLAERPDSMVINPDTASRKQKEPKKFADVFPPAVRALAVAAERYKPALKSQLDLAKDEMEKGPVLDSLDLCDQITAAVAKLPAEAPKPTGKKH